MYDKVLYLELNNSIDELILFSFFGAYEVKKETLIRKRGKPIYEIFTQNFITMSFVEILDTTAKTERPIRFKRTKIHVNTDITANGTFRYKKISLNVHVENRNQVKLSIMQHRKSESRSTL